MIGFIIFYQLSNFGSLYIEDKQSVSLHGHVNLTEDAAAAVFFSAEISKGISAVGSNIGLGGTIVGVGSAVGKVIAKSGMPPMQKAGIMKNYNLQVYNIQKRQFCTINKKPLNLLDKFLKDNNIIPVQLYRDLHLDTTNNDIGSKTKDLSGVYLIFNCITGHYYIGSASTNKFYARFYKHLISYGGSKIVKLAVKKYKLKNFAFLILELFTETVDKYNNKKLIDLEDFYLKSLLPDYNILTEAGSNFGYKHTEISRIDMKVNYSKERRDKIDNLNKGKSLIESTKLRLTIKALGRKPIIYTEEALMNMAKKSKPVMLINKDNTLYGEYTSIKNLADNIVCSYKTVRRAILSKSKLLKNR